MTSYLRPQYQGPGTFCWLVFSPWNAFCYMCHENQSSRQHHTVPPEFPWASVTSWRPAGQRRLQGDWSSEALKELFAWARPSMLVSLRDTIFWTLLHACFLVNFEEANTNASDELPKLQTTSFLLFLCYSSGRGQAIWEKRMRCRETIWREVGAVPTLFLRFGFFLKEFHSRPC